MEITKTSHDSGLGIYAESIPITDWKAAQAVADEMVEWMDADNGKFKGEHERAFAMAHCQVAPIAEPLRLFVVDKQLVMPKRLPPNGKQTLVNTFFEAQVIYNAVILEAKRRIVKPVPQRKVTRDPKNKGKVEVDIEMVEREIDNIIDVPEGCMSFPERKAKKNVKRYYTIKVRYQYYKKWLFFKKLYTFEGEVEGLKAHIFQHEIDHFNAENIFFKN